MHVEANVQQGFVLLKASHEQCQGVEAEIHGINRFNLGIFRAFFDCR